MYFNNVLNPSEDIVRIYLKQIGRFPLCTAEEEVEYFRRIKEGDENAKNEFATRNLRLVISIAKKYTPYSDCFLDLVQEGNRGLLKAIDKFDISKGFKFSTYAIWWIRGYITRAIPEHDRVVRIPIHANEDLKKYNKLKWEYELAGKVLKEYDVIRILGWSYEKLELIKRLNVKFVSLESLSGKDKEMIVPEDESTETIIETREMREKVREVMSTCLTPRQSAIVSMRFGLKNGTEMTFVKIASVFRIHRSRAGEINHKALRILRRNCELIEMRKY